MKGTVPYLLVDVILLQCFYLAGSKGIISACPSRGQAPLIYYVLTASKVDPFQRITMQM